MDGLLLLPHPHRSGDFADELLLLLSGLDRIVRVFPVSRTNTENNGFFFFSMFVSQGNDKKTDEPEKHVGAYEN